MQLFHAGMHVGWVMRARRESNQHADDVLFSVRSQRLAEDPRAHFVPLRFVPTPGRRRHVSGSRIRRQASGETRLKRGRRPQHVGWPEREGIDEWTKRFELAPAPFTASKVRFDRRQFLPRDGLQAVCACKFGVRARYRLLWSGVHVRTRIPLPHKRQSPGFGLDFRSLEAESARAMITRPRSGRRNA